jgi:hypothetical protein
MTRFESKSAHGCGEQWNVRDMMVYTGYELHEDKTLCPVCINFIMIAWIETPPTPPFIG